MNFKVIPISPEISAAARETMMSPQYKSLAASVSTATGYGPCRSCLRTFRQGLEDRIYITYNSSDGISSLPNPGPIFIHADVCEPYSADGFPVELRELPMLFEGFGEGDVLITRVSVISDEIENQITEILADQAIEIVKIRNAEAGCFIARIERSA